MLDDEDLEIVAFGGDSNGGCIGFALTVIILAVMYYFVSQNHAECEQKHCAHGTPTLQAHQCECVEKPE